MDDIKEKVIKLEDLFDNLSKVYQKSKKLAELSVLEKTSGESTFWNDAENARSVMQQMSDIRTEIDGYNKLETGIKTLKELLTENMLTDDFMGEVSELEQLAKSMKMKSFLSHPYDKKNAIISIHAGQGGTEAMDWCSMLYRMYLRYCEIKNWKTEAIEYSEGDEAGIKSVSFKVYGSFAYGYLKNEAGTHRLVRQSPFNANNLRQTSFALVGIMPELSEADLPQISIKDEDLDWQFYRSGGHGGQNVNKVSTAVRLKHIPTGIVVTAQTERFQEQNRKIALELLRAKVWLLEEERKKQNIADIKGEYRPASWGNQIRSYVLHPYKMIKDLRTNFEVSQPEIVLNGNLDDFIEAELVLNNNN